MKEEIYLLLDKSKAGYNGVMTSAINSYAGKKQKLSVVDNIAGTMCYVKIECDKPFESVAAYQNKPCIIAVYSRDRISDTVRPHSELYALSITPEWQEELEQ